MIKFLDLKSINFRYLKEFQVAMLRFFESGWYIRGQECNKFEEAFSKFCETKYCVGVANGLDALTLIFRAYIEQGKLKKGSSEISFYLSFLLNQTS